MLPTIQKPTLRRHQIHRDLAILVLVVVAFAIPFLPQPFHMDDNFYMDMARNALKNPGFPNDTPYVFEGRTLADMGSHSHPPLQTYFLAAVQKLAGEGEGKEWIYHSAGMVFPILAVVGFYFLGARFVERPIWPALGLAVAPLFMVMQHNLMTDVPTLAFWLAAIASFAWGVEMGSSNLLLTSSVFQFAAMFTSYQSFALAPLLGFYHLRSGRGRRGWICILAPILAMLVWLVLNYAHYGRLILIDTFGYVQSRAPVSAQALLTKLAALLGYQGWLIVFPFFLLYLLARGLKGRALGLAAIAAFYLTQIAVPEYRVIEKGIFAVGVISGSFVFLHMLYFALAAFWRSDGEAGFGRIESQFLGLWYVGVAVYCLFALPEGSARYVLPLAPPLLLYFFRRLEMIEIREYREENPRLLNASLLASGAAVLSLAFGLLLSYADLEFARAYPRAIREITLVLPDVTNYFAGEWGFRYYARQAGLQHLPGDASEVRGGSAVVSPSLALPYDLPADLRSMLMPVHSVRLEPSTPVRLLDRQCRAGFYSTHWGLLPFSLSRSILENLEVRQVNFMVDQLPWATVEGEKGLKPWPGYLRLQGLSPLSVLMKPQTTLTYPWVMDAPSVLDIRCGVDVEAYREGEQTEFRFEIQQLGAGGKTLAALKTVLMPGLEPSHRGWKHLRLELEGRREGALKLQFRYESNGDTESGTAAFAEAVVRPLPRGRDR